MEGFDDNSPERCSFIQGLKPADVALFRSVAREASENAVNGILMKMGLDPHQPLVSQEIFAALRKLSKDDEIPADLDWVRRTRLRTEGVFGKALIAAVAVGVVSGMHAAWAGIVAMLGQRQ